MRDRDAALRASHIGNTAMKTVPRSAALTIAGSDSGGGAGIQTDLRTFTAFGVHGTSAITALTAQNTRGVTAVHVAPGAIVRAQIDAVLDDFRIGAIKLGMLATPAIVRTVAAALAARPQPVVLDPVLVATTGARLATDDLAEALRRHLLPRAALVTPNVPEAQRLTGLRIRSVRDKRLAARALLDAGAQAVLLKGGHGSGRVATDLLLTPDGERWFEHARSPGRHHGTGCTLSAAIAAAIARGEGLKDAVETGIAFVQAAIAASHQPGRSALRVLDPLAAAQRVR